MYYGHLTSGKFTASSSNRQAGRLGKVEKVGTCVCLIMVIDASITVHKILETSLGREDYEVVSFPDGIEAMHWLAADNSHRPDLVILDIELPRLSGYLVIQRLKASPAFVSMPNLYTQPTQRHCRPSQGQAGRCKCASRQAVENSRIIGDGTKARSAGGQFVNNEATFQKMEEEAQSHLDQFNKAWEAWQTSNDQVLRAFNWLSRRRVPFCWSPEQNKFVLGEPGAGTS